MFGRPDMHDSPVCAACLALTAMADCLVLGFSDCWPLCEDRPPRLTLLQWGLVLTGSATSHISALYGRRNMPKAQKLPLVSLAEVQATSESDGHPILLAFDEGDGPGGTYWKAGDPGEQTITVAFREACRLAQVTHTGPRTRGHAHASGATRSLVGWRPDVPRTGPSGISLQPRWGDLGGRDVDRPTGSGHACAIGHQTGQRSDGRLRDTHDLRAVGL
nr:hypothetical protein [Nitrospira sp.]